MDALVFRLDRSRYALPLWDVVEVLPAVALTTLPMAPAIVEGVIDVRGRLVPVLDIRARFRLPARQMDLADHLVLARAGLRTVALRADEAIELLHLDAQDVEPIEPAVPGASYVAGVARTADGLILLHDLQTFLTHAESEQLGRALAEGGA
mgnify:FL=1